MMNREPLKFKAHLLHGEKKVFVEAKYASQFSLLIRFLNGDSADQKTDYRKLVFQKNGDEKSQGGRGDSIEIVTRTSESDTNLIEILFKDSGNGINKDTRNNIFDPFFTTKEVGKGTGLGLSISYGIISDHDGKIEIADTGPHGTTFEIKLPIESSDLNTKTIEEERIQETA
jgi:light-regulated signal transduction histidine kinase (bacteriophytochrome)